jgi:hypothetical protein
VEGFDPFVPERIASHYITAGTLAYWRAYSILVSARPNVYTKDYLQMKIKPQNTPFHMSKRERHFKPLFLFTLFYICYLSEKKKENEFFYH